MAAAIVAALSAPAAAQVQRVELDLAGYLCGF